MAWGQFVTTKPKTAPYAVTQPPSTTYPEKDQNPFGQPAQTPTSGTASNPPATMPSTTTTSPQKAVGTVTGPTETKPGLQVTKSGPGEGDRTSWKPNKGGWNGEFSAENPFNEQLLKLAPALKGGLSPARGIAVSAYKKAQEWEAKNKVAYNLWASQESDRIAREKAESERNAQPLGHLDRAMPGSEIYARSQEGTDWANNAFRDQPQYVSQQSGDTSRAVGDMSKDLGGNFVDDFTGSTAFGYNQQGSTAEEDAVTKVANKLISESPDSAGARAAIAGATSQSDMLSRLKGYFGENAVSSTYNNYFASGMQGPSRSETLFDQNLQGLSDSYWGVQESKRQRELNNQMSAMGLTNSGYAIRAGQESAAQQDAVQAAWTAAMAKQADEAFMNRAEGARLFTQTGENVGLNKNRLQLDLASGSDNTALGRASGLRLLSGDETDRLRLAGDLSLNLGQQKTSRTSQGLRDAVTAQGADISQKQAQVGMMKDSLGMLVDSGRISASAYKEYLSVLDGPWNATKDRLMEELGILKGAGDTAGGIQQSLLSALGDDYNASITGLTAAMNASGAQAQQAQQDYQDILKIIGTGINTLEKKQELDAKIKKYESSGSSPYSGVSSTTA